MPAKITLKVVKGQLGATQFNFDERAVCLIGKTEDCHLKVPYDDKYRMISRRHCLLDIHPPYIRLDLSAQRTRFIARQNLFRSRLNHAES